MGQALTALTLPPEKTMTVDEQVPEGEFTGSRMFLAVSFAPWTWRPMEANTTICGFSDSALKKLHPVQAECRNPPDTSRDYTLIQCRLIL